MPQTTAQNIMVYHVPEAITTPTSTCSCGGGRRAAQVFVRCQLPAKRCLPGHVQRNNVERGHPSDVEAAYGVRLRGGGPVWVEPERRGTRGATTCTSRLPVPTSLSTPLYWNHRCIRPLGAVAASHSDLVPGNPRDELQERLRHRRRQDLSPTSAMPSTTVMKTKTTTAITSKKQTTRAPNTVTKKAITTTSRTTPTMTETNPPIRTPASKQRTQTVMSDLPSTNSETPAFSKVSQSLHHHEASETGDSLSVTVKAFVGVAAACVAVTLVLVGYLLHKWRSSRRRYSASLHSTNPLNEEIETRES
ncbi:hypothetical protein MAR_009679, partial [Mya arenaria]